MRQGAISAANILRNLVGILSGPVALCGSRLDNGTMIIFEEAGISQQ